MILDYIRAQIKNDQPLAGLQDFLLQAFACNKMLELVKCNNGVIGRRNFNLLHVGYVKLERFNF